MRALSFIAFSLCLLSPLAGHAEVLAVCGGPAGNANPSILRTTLSAEAALTARLALWRDAKGFDLLLNWGEPTQHSLRAEGADIIGNEMGSDLVHLVVIREGKQVLEHFLFVFEEDAPGQLIWNGPEEATGDGIPSNETSCSKPN